MDTDPGVPGRRVEAVVVAGAAPADDVLTAAVTQARACGVDIRLQLALQLPYALPDPPRARRLLDLRTGLLEEREQTTSGPLTAVRFVSLARPGTVVLRAQVPDRVDSGGGLLAPSGARSVQCGTDDACWMRVPATTGGVTAAACTDGNDLPAGGLVLDRTAVHLADPDVLPTAEDPLQAVTVASEVGFDRLLREHRHAWAQRWERAHPGARTGFSWRSRAPQGGPSSSGMR